MPKPNTLLQEERKKRGWTQDQLAELIEADSDSVGNWESGRRGTSRYYQRRLVTVFGLPPERLGFPGGSAEVASLANTVVSYASAPEESAPVLSVLPLSRGENLDQVEHFLLDQEEDENRQGLLWQIRSTWIEGVMKHFLDPGILITLNLVELPEALENPWHLLVRETNGVAHELPKGTSIVQMYDIANEELLILGEPGAGKTTLLLDLARELLIRAEQNAEYPIPVIFNLTSWTRKRSTLAEWMVEEMQTKYHLPKEVAHAWIEDDQVIILLDGLDEIATEALSSCFKAIREYQDTRSRGLLVICCRQGDYFAQDVRLSLQKAVLIQPLTREQIDQYLTTADGQLETVRQAFQDDPELEEICTTPLLLNIATRAYQVKATAILTSGGSLETRRQEVFKAYIERMLSRRGMETRYDQQQTIHWLAWLAEQMQKRSQTEFYLERLQPTWLSNERMRHRFHHTVIRMVYGIECLIIAGLFALLQGGEIRKSNGFGAGIFGWLGGGSGDQVLGWMARGIGGGLGSGASLGTILAMVTILVSLMIGLRIPTLSLQMIRRGLITAVRYGGILGGIISILVGLVFTPQMGIRNGLAHGAGIGLFSGLLIGLQSGLIVGLRDKKASLKRLGERHQQRPPHPSLIGSLWSRRLLNRMFDFVTFGCCAGIGYGSICAWLSKGITQNVFSDSVTIILLFGIAFSWGNATEWFLGLDEDIQPAETVIWSWTAARRTMGATLKGGGVVGLIVTGCMMVILGTASGIFYGASYGIRFGFVYGPVLGLVGAIAGILTGILNGGWTTAIHPDHQMFQPNEGTHRSLKNAAFAACLFGPLGGLVSGLASGLAFGLIGGLPRWPVLGIGLALVFSVIFALQFALTYGGIAWLQHYLLRWYLWRSGDLPANCRLFFDYASERIFMIKVGGGYMFAHRLLLDYFASLRAAEPSQEEEKKLSHVNETMRQK